MRHTVNHLSHRPGPRKVHQREGSPPQHIGGQIHNKIGLLPRLEKDNPPQDLPDFDLDDDEIVEILAGKVIPAKVGILIKEVFFQQRLKLSAMDGRLFDVPQHAGIGRSCFQQRRNFSDVAPARHLSVIRRGQPPSQNRPDFCKDGVAGAGTEHRVPPFSK